MLASEILRDSEDATLALVHAYLANALAHMPSPIRLRLCSLAACIPFPSAIEVVKQPFSKLIQAAKRHEESELYLYSETPTSYPTPS